MAFDQWNNDVELSKGFAINLTLIATSSHTLHMACADLLSMRGHAYCRWCAYTYFDPTLLSGKQWKILHAIPQMPQASLQNIMLTCKTASSVGAIIFKKTSRRKWMVHRPTFRGFTLQDLTGHKRLQMFTREDNKWHWSQCKAHSIAA